MFLSVLPVFLQLVVEAGTKYPLQRPDCFQLLKVSERETDVI